MHAALDVLRRLTHQPCYLFMVWVLQFSWDERYSNGGNSGLQRRSNRPTDAQWDEKAAHTSEKEEEAFRVPDKWHNYGSLLDAGGGVSQASLILVIINNKQLRDVREKAANKELQVFLQFGWELGLRTHHQPDLWAQWPGQIQYS